MTEINICQYQYMTHWISLYPSNGANIRGAVKSDINTTLNTLHDTRPVKRADD